MNQQTFWQTLPKPIIGLAPMDGVTDQPFRFIQKKYGNPDLIFTEFVSVEGLCHSADVLLGHLIYDQSQRPIVAQIYGKTPDFFRQVALLICQLGFNGIDINMGCPAKNVAASGSGAALIQNPQLAKEIIKAAQLGVKDWLDGKTVSDCPDLSQKIIAEVEIKAKLLKLDKQRSIPISVKTRIGYSNSTVEEWIKNLLEANPAAIAIHGRTLKQGYGGLANWEEIARGVATARANQDKNNPQRTLILGNGDVQSRSQGEKLARQYGLDGVLIGRASFGNPYVFQNQLDKKHPSLVQIALEHAKVFEKTFANGKKYSFLPMRKHLGWYTKGLIKAKEIRLKLMQTQTSEEVEQIFLSYQLI